MCDGHDHSHDDTERDAALFDAHEERTLAYQDAAFKMPPPRAYESGALVWLRDHYNTGRVDSEVGDTTGRGDIRYVVETTDTEGRPLRMTYAIDQLRPATVEHAFRWPDGDESGAPDTDGHERAMDRARRMSEA